MAINSDLNFHSIVIAVNVFIRKDGKYLVLKRSPHKKILPNALHPVGGKVDAHEDPYEAAIREVREEAGIEIHNMRLEAIFSEIVHHIPKYGGVDWQIYHFSADYLSGTITATDEGEFVELSTEELTQGAEMFPSVKRMIKDILDPNKGTVFARFEFDEHSQITKESISYCIR